MHFEVIIRNH